MQMPGVARSLGAVVRTFRLRQDTGWEPDWDEFERAVTRGDAARLPLESEQPDRLRPVRRRHAAHRERCESTGAWLLADEVYLGAEIDRPRTKSFWGMSDRVDRHERAVEGVRHSGRADRLDRRAAVTGRRLLVPARLPHDRSEQDVGPARAGSRRPRESGTLLLRGRARSSGTTCRSPASGSRASTGG